MAGIHPPGKPLWKPRLDGALQSVRRDRRLNAPICRISASSASRRRTTLPMVSAFPPSVSSARGRFVVDLWPSLSPQMRAGSLSRASAHGVSRYVIPLDDMKRDRVGKKNHKAVRLHLFAGRSFGIRRKVALLRCDTHSVASVIAWSILRALNHNRPAAGCPAAISYACGAAPNGAQSPQSTARSSPKERLWSTQASFTGRGRLPCR